MQLSEEAKVIFTIETYRNARYSFDPFDLIQMIYKNKLKKNLFHTRHKYKKHILKFTSIKEIER